MTGMRVSHKANALRGDMHAIQFDDTLTGQLARHKKYDSYHIKAQALVMTDKSATKLAVT